jgi:hypothetical protein
LFSFDRFGNIPVYGEYGVRVPIGTPGWVFDVQVDTGYNSILNCFIAFGVALIRKKIASPAQQIY